MANFKGGFAFNNEAAKVEVEQAPDGTLISCVNPVTGESLGGGGGGGELYIFIEASNINAGAYLGARLMNSRMASTDPNLAAGVTVTIKTWNNYILDTIKGVTSGNTYTFTTVTQGTYTFTMPDESVYCTLLYDD